MYNKIKNMQNIYNLGSLNEEESEDERINNKSQERSKSHSRSKSASKKKKEEEIEKKVEQFRRRLRESISQDIETERANEAKRIRDYEDAKDILDKKLIEQRNKEQRKEYEKKITELNDNIEKYVDDYRKKLRDEAGLY